MRQRKIIEKSAAIDNLEFAARTLRWYLEVKNFADTLETIAKSIDMAAATLEHASPYARDPGGERVCRAGQVAG